MSYRTIITNPQDITIFEKKLIKLHFGNINILTQATPYRLNLRKLPLNEYKNHLIGLTGVIKDFRINIELGTVEDLLASGTTTIKGEMDLEGYEPRFFLYFHTKRSKTYSAISETFKAKKDNTNYDVILPTEAMQGEVIWDLELNEDLGPLLKLNTEVLDVRNLMRRDISWQALIIPMAIKQILNFYAKVWSGSLEHPWQKKWAEFIKIYADENHLASIPEQGDTEAIERWANLVVDSFCTQQNYKLKINENVNLGDDEDE